MANQDIPVLQKEVNAEMVQKPEFQSSVQAYAESNNFLSAIGAKVAQTASNQIAKQVGTEMGKNPKPSDLMVPAFTDFDKQFEQSYKTQAKATLSLQGQKLLDDTDIQLAQSKNLTPQLIAKSSDQLKTGLKKIADQAPFDVQADLQKTFDSSILEQNTQYTKKMISQQREDQRNTIINSLQLSSQKALEFGKSGDVISANLMETGAKQIADSAAKNRLLTPSEARVAQDTVTQSRLNGIYINQAMQAYQAGKLGEFKKKFAEKKPEGMTNQQWIQAGQAITTQLDFLKGLSSESQQIESLKFDDKIVKDVNSITGLDLAEYKSKVSPVQYEQTYLKYLKAKKDNAQINTEYDTVIAGWNNAQVFNRATPKVINGGFNRLVQQGLINSQREGTGLSLEEIEARVASAANGPVPQYIDVLNGMLRTSDANQIASAGKSIDYIYQAEKGGNLIGLTPESKSMYNIYSNLRRYRPSPEAAQMAYDTVYNQTLDEQEAVKHKWVDTQKAIRAQGELSYYTSLASIKSDQLVDPQAFINTAYSLLDTYFHTTKGDLSTAQKMVAQDLTSSYGPTNVNGKNEVTYLSLENVLGLPSDSFGIIQNNIIEQTSKKLEPLKQSFMDGHSQYYYQIEPKVSAMALNKEVEQFKKDHPHENPNVYYAFHGQNISKPENSPITIKKIWKDGHVETFPLIVKADPWLVKTSELNKPYTGYWDIVLGTEHSVRPLIIQSPGSYDLISYKPDSEKIRSEYLNLHKEAEPLERKKS